MELPIGAIDTVLHLAIFLAGALSVGALALAVLDRVTGDGQGAVGWRWPIAAAATFVGLLGVERLFHVLT